MEELVILNKQLSIHNIKTFTELSKYYDVWLISDCPLTEWRMKTAGWQIPDVGNIHLHFLSEDENPTAFIRDFISRHTEAIYLLCGLWVGQGVGLALPQLLKLKEPRISVLMERPNRKTGWKKWLAQIYYRRILARSQKKIGAFFPIGRLGEEAYKGLGVPSSKIFSNMYTYCKEYMPLEPPRSVRPPLKLIYVGEAVRPKGIDILLEAVSRFTSEEIHFSFVGNDRFSIVRDTVDRLALQDRVTIHGIIPNEKIPATIAQNDVLVLPSLDDGWGMVTTEAIIAGTGVIVTDVCGSRDLVEVFDAGRVISADVEALTDSIRFCLDNPDEVLRWKKNAALYRDRTRPYVVADYMKSVYDYVFKANYQGVRPIAGWLDLDVPIK